MKTKEIVLRCIMNAHSFISGEEIAARCGISRQAVWKAVNALRKDGVQIEAVTNSGYKLSATNTASTTENILSESVINSLLPENLSARAIVYDEIDSTNLEAKRRCEQVINSTATRTTSIHSLDGTVIVANCQTAGRGRLGRSFFSPAGSGLYLSIIYSPKENITTPAVLTASAAVSVCRAIASVYNLQPQIKWVNDIFLRGKKICGILTEGVTNFETGTIDYAIIGIGINVLPGSFPPEIADIATSIFEDKKDGGISPNVKRNELAAAVILETLKIFHAGENGFKEAMKEYRERLFMIGQKVIVSPVIGKLDSQFEATVIDVNNNAKLIVQKENGDLLELDSGEISIHSENIIKAQ